MTHAWTCLGFDLGLWTLHSSCCYLFGTMLLTILGIQFCLTSTLETKQGLDQYLVEALFNTEMF